MLVELQAHPATGGDRVDGDVHRGGLRVVLGQLGQRHLGGRHCRDLPARRLRGVRGVLVQRAVGEPATMERASARERVDAEACRRHLVCACGPVDIFLSSFGAAGNFALASPGGDVSCRATVFFGPSDISMEKLLCDSAGDALVLCTPRKASDIMQCSLRRFELFSHAVGYAPPRREPGGCPRVGALS